MQKQPSVLVIEDALEIAAIYTEILEMNGMSVEHIADGALALRRLAGDAPDLILLDMHLPNVSGLELLTYIRESAHLRHTRVVAITANALLGQDLEDKADLTLIKPVNFTQINELTQRMLRVPSAASRAAAVTTVPQ